MNRHFIYLKAAVVVLAVTVAGISTGFHMDKLAARFDPVHYNAVVQANASLHCASHNVSHALGRLWSHIGSKQASVLSD
ncbi:MAG TPA: hypothetical protein VG867_11420 [Rhizomicrobium sp.]|nr:hypothetical protein [Rhizomicrobium sp.]